MENTDILFIMENTDILNKLDEFENNEAIKNLTIKSLNKDDYFYNIHKYYEKAFELMYKVDNAIQSILTPGAVNETNYTYYCDFSKWIDIKEAIMLYNTIKNRLFYEHGICENSNKYFSHYIDYKSKHFKFTLKPLRPNSLINYQYEELTGRRDTRCSGRTTRLIDEYIQDSYINKGNTIILSDHFSEQCRDMRRIGLTNHGGATAADRMLVQRLKRRIHNELPEDIFRLYRIINTTCTLNLILPDKHVIEYSNFE